PPGGPQWYADRVIDQGIGRAMWFVGGADADLVATLIDRFPESRRGDLYGGAGLAATYAGGAEEAELRLLADRAGSHRFQVAQGAPHNARRLPPAAIRRGRARCRARPLRCWPEPQSSASAARTGALAGAARRSRMASRITSSAHTSKIVATRNELAMPWVRTCC